MTSHVRWLFKMILHIWNIFLLVWDDVYIVAKKLVPLSFSLFCCQSVWIPQNFHFPCLLPERKILWQKKQGSPSFFLFWNTFDIDLIEHDLADSEEVHSNFDLFLIIPQSPTKHNAVGWYMAWPWESRLIIFNVKMAEMELAILSKSFWILLYQPQGIPHICNFLH